MEVATGMVFLTDDGRVVWHRPVVAAVPQRPPGSGETVAGVHETSSLIPFDTDVIIVLRFFKGDAASPLLLSVLQLLIVVVAGLELVFLSSCMRWESAVERGPSLLHLTSGDKSLLAAPPVGVLFQDVVNKPGEGPGLLLVPA
jgi:hypothetical protein